MCSSENELSYHVNVKNVVMLALSSSTLDACVRNLFQSGGAQVHVKNYRQFCSLRFELATVTSQALKYGVITYTPYGGLNYTILDKSKPL